LKKCIFCAPFGTLLGHIIYKERILFDPDKIFFIINMHAPTSVKQLRSTLGHTRYYRRFIHSYASITTPLEKLLKKYKVLSWTHECETTFSLPKENIVSTPIWLGIHIVGWDKLIPTPNVYHPYHRNNCCSRNQ